MPRHNSATPQEILRLAAARINAGEHAAALALCNEALALVPDDVSGLINRGLALIGLDDAAAARRSFNRAINEDPTVGTAWNGLGQALFDLGEPAKAAEAFRTAAGLMADTDQARYHRGMALLSMGDFTAGWAEYDHRVDMPSMKMRRYDAPRWAGEPLDGRRLLVVAEQGYGDMIQFARLLPRAAACGGPVIFEAPAELLPVFAPLSASVTLRAMEDGPVPGAEFDCHTHLMSLPAALSLTEDTIPADIPYVAAPADRVAHWHGAMAGDGLKIGLCWAGRPSHPQDMQRSMDCRHLAPLAAMHGLRLFSLQKSLEKFPMAPEIRDRLADDFSRLPENFSETAAIVANLDLLVTVDTSLAHLAGALGTPVWVLLPCAADWRWMRGRSDTPWYPTMRLFRQEAAGDWGGVTARVSAALADYPS
jgi:hypothetical protein